jgi:hypothetical protein
MPIENGARGRWRWILLGLLALTLRARPAGAQDPGEIDVPSGTVAFLVGDSASCPAGWRPATEASGRLVIAVTTGDTVGKQVGTALQSEEDRTHVHPFATAAELPYKPLAALNGGNHQGAAAAKYTDSGTSEPSPSGLPFVQLLMCAKP